MARNKKRFAVVIAVASVLCMVFSGCSGATGSVAPSTAAQSTAPTTAPAVSASAAPTATPTQTAPPTKQPEVVMTIWFGDATVTGEQHNPVSDAFASATGVRLNIVNGDTSKYQLLIAGGDLPEIVSSYTTINDLLSSGQVIELDSLIDKYGKNLKTVFPQKLEYSKKFLSNGANKTYFLPVSAFISDPTHPDIRKMGASQATYLRWDVYAKVGYPAITSYDDLLSALKKMQDANPANKDGKKVYAISGWSDWGIWPWYISNMYNNGCQDMAYDIWFDDISGTPIPMFTDDRFWQSVSFYNKAYRQGLLDPEAFTMKWNNFTDKCKDGEVLMCFADWMAGGFNDALVANGYKDAGFEYVMSGQPYVSAVIATDNPVGFGSTKALCLTKNCKNSDKAMQFIDYLNGYEGSRLAWSGIEGKHYEVKDGVPVATQTLINGLKTDTNFASKEGYQLFAGLALNNTQTCPDGFPADVRDTDVQKAQNLNAVDQSFCQHFGSQYKYPGQVVYDFVNQGKIKTWTKNWIYKDMVGLPSDDTQKIMSAIDEYMKVQIAAIIMAKTDADFTAQVAKAKADIETKGYSKAYTEILSLYTKAQSAIGDFDPYKK